MNLERRGPIAECPARLRVEAQLVLVDGIRWAILGGFEVHQRDLLFASIFHARQQVNATSNPCAGERNLERELGFDRSG